MRWESECENVCGVGDLTKSWWVARIKRRYNAEWMISACCHPFLCILMKQPPSRHLSLLFAPIFVSEPPVRWRGKEGTGGAPRRTHSVRPRGLARSVRATNIIHCPGGALIRVKSCLRFPPLRRKLFRPTRALRDYVGCWLLIKQYACVISFACISENSSAFALRGQLSKFSSIYCSSSSGNIYISKIKLKNL